MNENQEIKPCPFCGMKVNEIEDPEFTGYIYVTCSSCCAQGPLVRSSKKSIEAWNERA